MPFSKTWDEAYPASTDPADDIDLYIQDDKIATRERLESLLGIADFSTRYPMSADALKVNGAANTKILGGSATLAITDNTGANTRVLIDTTNGDITSNGVLISNKLTRKVLAQISGSSAGFDLFTPTQGVLYDVTVFGKDASGVPTNAYIDKLVVYSNGTVTKTNLSSTTLIGAPGARTYSNSTGKLYLAHAGAPATYYVDLMITYNSLT